MTVKAGNIYRTTDARRNARYKVLRVSNGYAVCAPRINGKYRENIQRRMRVDRLRPANHWELVRAA